MKESVKYMNHSKLPTRDSKLKTFKRKIELIEKYVAARNACASNNFEEAIRHLDDLLVASDAEDAVRSGDIYGLLVEIYFVQHKFDKAYEYVQRMKSKKIQVSWKAFCPNTQFIGSLFCG